MSNERVILCGDAVWPAQQQGLKEPICLQLSGSQPNIDLRIQDISKRFAANISDVFIDLLEIATYIYCADQAVTRGGKTDKGVGANWRRHLRFFIPVRRPDVWNSPAISECLSRTLGFLSDDFYNFTFAELKNPPPFEKYFEGLDNPNLQPPEELVLYSGGLDSLAGAVREAVIEKKRALLVSHRASPKILAKQLALFKDLTFRLGLGDNPVPTHVPVWITKHGAWGGEYTQRTRSFLYCALGATLAHLFGLPMIRMYENGIVSFNLPISAQLIGARASRTTHPQVLKGFGDLISLITEKPFQVENPFLWKTRAEVVRFLGENGCADLIKSSVSCSHVREMTTLHSHCGKCSQCIDRRFAVLASGYGDYEPSEMYKVDLLTGARETLEDRTMLESYVRTATEVARMSEIEFFSHFGEASRVFSHLEGTADENAAKILDLHKRHAGQICDVIDSAIQNHVKEIREGTLPSSCLLILALPEAYRRSAEIPTDEMAKSRNIFRKEGDVWRIVYDGEEKSIKHTKGLSYLAILLRNPRRSLHVFDLIQEVGGSPYSDQIEIFKQMDREKWEEEGLSLSRPKELVDKARKAVHIAIQRSLKKIKRLCP
ncbi:MAG: 7-cyano-7-deazaguanine synthase [Desulfobaccales bacterium]